MSYPNGIYETLDALGAKIKRLCCSVEQIQQSGAGSYKVYTAFLSQTGTSTPTTTILEDAFGFGWTFVRDAAGSYEIQDSTNNPFTDNKTIGFVTLSGGAVNLITNFSRASISDVQFSTIDPATGNKVDLNGYAQIEIRVYN